MADHNCVGTIRTGVTIAVDPTVELWLMTFEGRDWPSSGKGRTLWHRSVLMAHLPGPDDEIMTLWSAENQEWFMPVGFKRRYWSGDGGAHLELHGIIVNPDEEGEKQIMAQLLPRDAYRYTVWRDDDNGDEIWPFLWAAGWNRYGEGV